MEIFEETIAKQQKEIEFLNKQIKSYQNLIHISIGMLDELDR